MVINLNSAIKKIAYGFIIITIIFTSGYALSTVEEYASLKWPLLIISTILAIFLGQKQNVEKRRTNQKNWILFVALALLSGFSTFFNFNSVNFNSWVVYLLVLLLALLITNSIEYKTFLECFLNIMSFICIVAVIAFIITDVLGIDPGFPLVKNTNNTVYQNGIIWFRIKYADFSPRLLGLFWEPGLLASYTSIALLITFLAKPKSQMFKYILYIATLLLSKSTAGYLLLILVLIVGALQLSGWKKYVSVFVLLCSFITVLVFMDQIYTYLLNTGLPVFQKLDLTTETSGARLVSMYANIETWKTSPLIGVGLGNANNLFSLSEASAQTSTSFYLMAAFGIFGLLTTILFVIGSIKIGLAKSDLIVGLTVAVIVFFTLNKEPHTAFLIDYIFMFYMINDNITIGGQTHDLPS